MAQQEGLANEVAMDESSGEDSVILLPRGIHSPQKQIETRKVEGIQAENSGPVPYAPLSTLKFSTGASSAPPPASGPAGAMGELIEMRKV